MELDDLTLLCIDDEIQILNSLKRSLRQEPYKLLTAPGAKEALELLKTNAIQVVVTDYRMPEMNGLELAKRIEREYPHIIIIMLSGYADPEAMNASSKYKFLFKPWEDHKLKEEIKNSFRDYKKNQKE